MHGWQALEADLVIVKYKVMVNNDMIFHAASTVNQENQCDLYHYRFFVADS